MPIPLAVARFNRRVTNRVTGRIARYLPMFGVLFHTGRRTHRQYRTPLNVFRTDPDHYMIALTYGREVDWLKNLRASGGGKLQTRGEMWAVSEPRVFHDERRATMPRLVRVVLGFAKVYDFVELKARRLHV